MASSSRPWIETVRRLLDMVAASDVSELQIAHNDFLFRVVRDVQAALAAAAAETASTGPDAEAMARLHTIVAPLTGVFYRAPGAGTRPYAVDGDWVEEDAVIGLIETMKVFNEVTTDRAGRVVTFQVQNGQLVHTGDTLVLLEPAERSAASPETSEP